MKYCVKCASVTETVTSIIEPNWRLCHNVPIFQNTPFIKFFVQFKVEIIESTINLLRTCFLDSLPKTNLNY